MKLLRNTVISLGLKASLVGVGFLQNAVLARWMTPQEFGAYTIAFTICLIAGGIATLGQHIAILRFWPEYASSERYDLARGVLEFSYLVTVGGCAIVLALFYTGVLVLNEMSNGVYHFLVPAGPLIACWALSEVLMSTLQAQGQVFWSTVPRDLFWRLGVIALASSFALRKQALDAGTLLLFSAAILFVLVSAQYVVSRAASPMQNAVSGAESLIRRSGGLSFDQDRWLRATARWSTAAIVAVTVGQVDTPIIGFLLDHQSAGAYFVVQRTSLLLTLPLSAVNVFYGPQFSALYRTGQLAQLQKVTTRTSLILFACAAPVFAVFQLGPEYVLRLYGEAYAGYGYALRILSVGYLIDVLTGPVAIILLLADREMQYSRIIILACLFRIASLSIAACFGNLAWVALASMLSQALMVALLWRCVRLAIPIEPSLLASVLPSSPSARPPSLSSLL